jgi:hypothetical protein
MKMLEFLLIFLSVGSFVAAVALTSIAAIDLYPYIPPQFNDPLMSRYAFIEIIYQPRIPLAIQFKSVCATIFACVAFGGAALLWFLQSRNGVAGYLFLTGFVTGLYASIVAVRKYRANAVSSQHKPSV